MMNTERRLAANKSGFTLVELMVTFVVAFLVSAAVYASYKIQQQTHKAQMQVTEIQQNIRAAMDMISREFIMAGFDPGYTGEYGVLPTLTDGADTYTTGAATFAFTADMCEDGGEPHVAGPCPANSGPFENQSIPERYLYRLYIPGTADADDTFSLQRTPGGQAIADNIETLEFFYILDTGVGTLNPNANQLENLRAIRVTIVARADDPDYKYTNIETYTTGSGVVLGPYNDNFRRRILVQTIELRNAGLI